MLIKKNSNTVEGGLHGDIMKIFELWKGLMVLLLQEFGGLHTQEAFPANWAIGSYFK